MAVTVNIPTPLRKLTNNESEVSVEAGSVGDLVDALEAAYSGIAEKLLDEKGDIRRYVNVFVNPIINGVKPLYIFKPYWLTTNNS